MIRRSCPRLCVLVGLVVASTTLAGAAFAQQAHQLTDAELEGILTEELERLGVTMSRNKPDEIARWFGLPPSAGKWVTPVNGTAMINSIYLGHRGQPVPGALASLNKATGPYLAAGGELQVGYEIVKGAGSLTSLGDAWMITQSIPAIEGAFTWTGRAGYMLTVATALAEPEKVQTSTALKLANGLVGLIYSSNPAVGCTVWLLDWCIGRAEKFMAMASTEIVFSDYATYYTGVHWPTLVEGGSLDPILARLDEYWDTKVADSVQPHLDWVKVNIADYKEVFAARLLREIAGPQLQQYFESEARWAKEKAVESLRDYLRSIPSRRATIFWKLEYQNLAGRRLDINPKLDVEVWFGNDTQLDEDLYEVSHSSTRLEVTMSIGDYLRGVSASEGIVGLRVFTEVAGQRKQLPASPATIYLPLGEDETDGPIRVQNDGQVLSILPEKTMQILVWTLPVKVRVITPDGSIASGSISGPSGKTVEIGADGFAYISLPSSGPGWVRYTAPGYASGGDAATIFDASKGDLANLSTVTIQVPDSDTLPPLPAKPSCDYQPLAGDAEDALSDYRRGDIDAATFRTELGRLLQSIEVAIDNAQIGRNQYSDALNARVAERAMTPSEAADILRPIDEQLNQDYRDANAVMDDLRDRANNAGSEWYSTLADVRESLERSADVVGQHASVVWQAAKIASQSEYFMVELVTPRSFRKLADVQTDRTSCTEWIDRIEAHRSEADIHLKDLGSALRVAGVHLTQFQETTPMVAGRWPLQPRVYGALNNGERAHRLGDDILDSCDAAEERVRSTDSLLSWVQLGVLRSIEHAEAFDALYENPPEALLDDSPEEAILDQIEQLLGSASAQRSWSTRVARYRHPSGNQHDGYGVAAYPYFAEADVLFRASTATISSAIDEGERWTDELAPARQQLEEDLAAMQASSWIVVEVQSALRKRVNSSNMEGLVERLAKRRDLIAEMLDADRVQYDATRAQAQTAWNTLLDDLKRYRALLERGLAAVRAGSLQEAEQVALDSEPLSVSRQQPLARELLLDAEVLDLEDQFFAELHTLRMQAEEAKLATLTLVLDGDGLQTLDINIVDDNGIEHTLQGGTSPRELIARLEAGTYTLTASGIGLRVLPSRVTVTLAESGSQTLRIVSSKVGTGGSGGQKPPTGGTGSGTAVYDPSQTKRRVVAVNLHIPDDSAPVWIDDHTVVVGINWNPFGLMAFDLRQGSSRRLLTEKPVIPHQDDSTTICHQPVLAGSTLICRMNMRYYDLGVGRDYYYWISVPLDGGPAAPMFRSELEALIGTTRNGYLMVGTQGGSRSILTLPIDAPSDDAAQRFAGTPPQLGERVVINTAVGVVATADWRQPWRLYTTGGAPIATLPESIGRWLAFSPNGEWSAGEHFDGQSTSGVAVLPVTTNPTPLVVDTKGVTFGHPAWSPDGRYLAYRAFQGNDLEEFVILDLQPSTGSSLADGGPIFEPPRPTPTPAGVTRNADQLYQKYIETYNALTTLMAEGKGDTPEAQAAYAAYQESKRQYEEAVAGGGGQER